uniref:Uncharacterized protein n=1 Tax=Leersia perrieri TaxID=77586 RepID=A0A0D9XRB3_9ORYZ
MPPSMRRPIDIAVGIDSRAVPSRRITPFRLHRSIMRHCITVRCRQRSTSLSASTPCCLCRSPPQEEVSITTTTTRSSSSCPSASPGNAPPSASTSEQAGNDFFKQKRYKETAFSGVW